MSEDYSLSTKISYDATLKELREEFRKWGIDKYSVDTFNEVAVAITYYKGERPITLKSEKQNFKKDNLRVLLLVIRAIRLNEVRGFGEIVASHYKQLSGSTLEEANFDPYQVLKIQRGTELEIVKAVYRTMATKYHPDSKPSGNVEMFKRITKAFKMIEEELS